MQAPAEDRILPTTRWVAALVIPFLVVAFVILYLLPRQTGQLFAWGIKPPMSAMMLGAAYIGGVYYFTGVLRGRRWHRVKVGVPPVIAFAATLGLATVLHWDKFSHGHVSFWAWAGLYFTTPFIVFAVWLRNRGQDSGAPEPDDLIIPAAARVAAGAVGAITLLTAATLFALPALMIGWWPWALSPLTARVMGAMFALPGLVGLGIAADRRWSAARLILEAQSLSIVFILIAAARDWADFDQANPLSWGFVIFLAAILLGNAAVYMAVEARRRAPRAA